MHILVACHEPSARDALLDGLRRAGFGAIVAPSDAGATLELVRRRHPDVVFLDNQFPGLNGVPGLKRMVAETGGAPVVTVAGGATEPNGLHSLLSGAMGYVNRQISPAALRRIVAALMRGEAAIPRSMTTALIELARSDAGMRPVRSALTAREWEVLDLMTLGASNQEISNDLLVSVETVQSHIKHILRKLGVHSRAEAIARADDLRRHRSPPAPE
jgi:two-component system, NarL family, response regulator LiaR